MNFSKLCMLLLVIIACAAVAYHHGGFGGWFMCYSLLVLGLMQIATLWTCRSFRVQCSGPEVMTAGESFELEMEIQGRCLLPFISVQVQDEWHERTLFFHSRRPYHYRVRIPGLKRGVYESGELQVRVEDVFGWFSRTFTVSAPFVCTVIPRERVWPFPLPTAHTEAEQEWHVRPYRSGDSQRRIHWRLSAKQGKRVVKQEERAKTTRRTIWMDGRLPPSADPKVELVYERMLEYTAGLLRQLPRGEVCDLHVPGAEALTRVRIPDGLTQLQCRLAAAAQVQSGPATSTVHPISSSVLPPGAKVDRRAWQAGSPFIWLTMWLEASAVKEVIHYAQQGRTVVVVCFVSLDVGNSLQFEHLQRLRRVGARVLIMRNDSDIDQEVMTV